MAKKYSFTFICFNNPEGERSVTHAENIDTPSFKCARCGLRLVWKAKDKSFGAHGKTKDDIKHELRKVQELK
jgi:hypothetical protein